MYEQRTNLRGLKLDNDIKKVTNPQSLQLTKGGRSKELIERRNDLLIACYVFFKLYHREYNYEYTLERVSEMIGFVAPFTISKYIMQYSKEIRQLAEKKPSKKWFRDKYQFINWK